MFSLNFYDFVLVRLINIDPYSSTVPLIKKVVVVAPVSLLGSWKKEVKKWLGDARLIPKIAIGKREEVRNTIY